MPPETNSPAALPSEDSVDVLVIGGGPGGTPAAMALAQAGRRVMLVKAGEGLGGTCLFSGCIPSKIFRETAFSRREVARGAEFGLVSDTNAHEVDWSTVQSRRHRILAQRSGGALAKAGQLPGLEVVFGRARLTGPRSALIERVGEPARDVRFERAILATGSSPMPSSRARRT